MSGDTTELAIGSPLFSGDDLVLPFQTVHSGVVGRLVRLGPLVDTILTRHDYPLPVSTALGEAIALTTLLGAALKFDGSLTLQTKTDGPLDFLVVNYESPGKLRGYASFDKDRVTALEVENASRAEREVQAALLGSGYLALTIDPGGDMDRYQGIVALSGEPLADAAFTYFRQSEQLPTFIKLAVARHYDAKPEGGEGARWQWRAGGLLLQHVSPEGGIKPADRSGEDHDAMLLGDEDDGWNRARLLAATVEDHELLDPTLAPDRLLFRLFHEEGVRAHAPQPLEVYCRCSRERIDQLMVRFGADELADMRESDGAVAVTCEFCATTYRFTPGDVSR